MPEGRTPRQAWIDAGFRVLASGGPDAVRIEALARSLGVSKGGFYWHFEDRRALLDEMLEAWERKGVDDVIDQVDAAGGDARARLRHLSRVAGAGESGLQVDLAMRAWARRDRKVAARMKRVDDRRMAYMRSLFGEFCSDEREVEVRALLMYTLWFGNSFIAADHGPYTRAEVVRLALDRLEA